MRLRGFVHMTERRAGRDTRAFLAGVDVDVIHF